MIYLTLDIIWSIMVLIAKIALWIIGAVIITGIILIFSWLVALATAFIVGLIES